MPRRLSKITLSGVWTVTVLSLGSVVLLVVAYQIIFVYGWSFLYLPGHFRGSPELRFPLWMAVVFFVGLGLCVGVFQLLLAWQQRWQRNKEEQDRLR